nr:hypothetical protein [Tanacetum cinerariifolium]
MLQNLIGRLMRDFWLDTLENKHNVEGSGPTWLFDIDTLTKSMNYYPVTGGNQSNPSAGVQEQFDAEKTGEKNVQQYVLFPLWSSSSKDPQNINGDATFEVKEPEFEVEKPKAKGKSPVEFSTGYKNLSEEFEDFFDKIINEVNAACTPVPVVGQISTNSINPFSVAALEDITYYDDEDDVGVEADFTNLETTITVSPILTTRVHKDHHVTQIIGDLSTATQTRNPDYPDKVYKVVKALYGLHEAPKAWYETLANYLLENDLCKAFNKLLKDKFQMNSMGELIFFLGLQVKPKPDGIYINQDKYVAKILRKFGLTDGKSASTPIDTKKLLLKDPNGEDVDVHTYRSMIGSLMYLTSSRPDIMLVAYSDSDYAGASLDRKSTIGGCQFLGCSLISWQCKKQTVVATSSTKAEVGKGFSGVETPLFEGILVPQQAPDSIDDVVADSVPSDDVAVDVPAAGAKPTPQSHHLLLLHHHHHHHHHKNYLPHHKLKLGKKKKLKVSGLKRLLKVGTAQRIESSADAVMDDQEDASK